MFPSSLITFREVTEAALIVATITGILRRLGVKDRLRIVMTSTLAAVGASVALVFGFELVGMRFRSWYVGSNQQLLEGSLMLVAAICISWSVFMINRNFGEYKSKLHEALNTRVNRADTWGLFILIFTSVFREGFEIVLFLTTLSLTTNHSPLLVGFLFGLVVGLLFAVGIFATTIKLHIRLVFRVTSALLILFAAGLLARGTHEFTEAGVLPEMSAFALNFIPEAQTLIGGFVKSMFGITRHMTILQLNMYILYSMWMGWWVYARKSRKVTSVSESSRADA
jgi:high-affinity iron transporter